MNIKSFVDENLKYAVAFAMFISASSLFVSVANLSTSTEQINSLANTAAVGNTLVNAAVPAGVTVAVNAKSGGSILKLAYDSTKKEASLNATFAISINGGSNGFYLYSYPQISFHDSNGGVYYVNSQRNSISPIINAQKKVDMYGNTVYLVPAGKVAVFLATATVDPKTLFAGSYFAQFDGLIGYPQLNNSPWGFTINAGFKTNSVTIVGEVTPYISLIDPNQVNVGDKMIITGQRLTGSVPYFDGVVSTTSLSSISSDGTTMVIKAPAISGGWHSMQVGNKKGMSNNYGLQIKVPSTSITVISPNQGDVYLKGTPVAITWGGMWSGNDTFGIEVDTLNGDTQMGKWGSVVTNLTQAQSGCAGYGKSVCGYSWTPTATGTQIIVVYDNQTGEKVQSGQFSVVNSTSTCPTNYTCTTAPVVSNASAILGTGISKGSTGPISMYPVTFNFTVTAQSDPVYISSTNSLVFNNKGLAPSPINLVATGSSVPGDGSGYYIIQPGAYRSFTLNSMVSNPTTSPAVYPVQIVAINYGTNSSNLTSSSIVTGLDNLRLSAVF